MSATVILYQANYGPTCDILMPEGAKVLEFIIDQWDNVQLAALVDMNAPVINHRFYVVVQGGFTDEPLGAFVNSVMLTGGLRYYFFLSKRGHQ